MSNANSWEDDPAAKGDDQNLANQAQQQLNLQGQGQNRGPTTNAQAGSFRPGGGVPSFQPGAQSFQPSMSYGNYQQQPYGQQQQQQSGGYGYPYGGGSGYNNQQQQQQQQGYGNQNYQQQQGYQQGYNNYNQGGYGYNQYNPRQPRQNQNYQYNQYPNQNPNQPRAYQPPQQSSGANLSLNAPKSGAPKVLSLSADSATTASAAPTANSSSGAAPVKVLSLSDTKSASSSTAAPVKVLSIGGGDATKPAASNTAAAPVKVLSIGGDATPKPAEEKTTEEKEDQGEEVSADSGDKPNATTATAEDGAKAAAVKAIKKTNNPAGPSSNKTSPSSSGRSSPTAATSGAKVVRDAAAVEKEQAADVDEDTLKEIYGKEHVNIIFIGHVDAGKSTLGGSLLYLTGMVDERTMEKYKREAKDAGRENWYLSWVLDINKEERAQGKTVEVGRAFFETEKRRYTVLDAPGHKTYVPSMITGASQADIGCLVISARKGEYETGFERGGQTREHAVLARTLGVNRLIVVINKMDDATVEWSQERYDECVSKLTPYLKGTGYNPKTDVYFLPVSAQQGYNIKERVSKDVAPWWEGPSLLEYLDGMKALERKVNAPFMMAVNGKYRDLGTMIEGKVETGVIKKGMSLVMMPNKQNVDVTAVYGETEEEVNIAQCGEQVRVRLRGVEEEDVLPGFVLCSPKRLVHCVSQFEAQIRIIDLKSILTTGFNCVLHVHSAIEEVTFTALLHSLQKGTNRRSKKAPTHAKKGDSIIARIQVIGGAGMVCIERFEDYPQMGRFTLRDQGQTIAIGKVLKLIEE